jgi:hypothetical protein
MWVQELGFLPLDQQADVPTKDDLWLSELKTLRPQIIVRTEVND